MPDIAISELPAAALLQPYRSAGDYTDCFSIEVPRRVSQAAFVEAFYTSALFRLERMVLAWLASRPSRDAEVRELAAGQRTRFAAWSVEGRAHDQLLLCDFQGSTRSWLMTAPGADGHSTRLYFGSAVVRRRQGKAFRALLGLHQLYSRLLLRAAAARVIRA